MPACSGNTVENGGDALCGAAAFTCPGEGELRYRVYTRQHDANGDVADGAGTDASVQVLGQTIGPGAPYPLQIGAIQSVVTKVR